MALRILLISPPIFDFYYTDPRKEPLGLLYLQKSVEDFEDVEVVIYDSLYKRRKKRIGIPHVFSHLGEIYYQDQSPFSLFSNYQRFGDSYNRIVETVRKGGFDLVGISSLFTGYHDSVEDLVAKLKDKLDVPIVLGGWAIKAGIKDLRFRSKADFLITGDESAFRSFVRGYIDNQDISSIPGVYVREESEDIKEKPKASLLSFDFEQFPSRLGKYRFRKNSIAKMTISRGCKYKCQFCSIHLYNEFKVRSLESINNELEYLHKLGVEIVNFEDDNLFQGLSWSHHFLDILESFHRRGMRFSAMNGMTAINVLPILDRVIDAGFIELNLSMVTSCAHTLKGMKRISFKEAIEDIVSRAKGRVEILVFLILGLPGHSHEKVLEDINWLAKLPIRIGVSPLYLLPDIPFFEKVGLPEDWRLMRGSALYKFGSEFTREDIASIWKYVRGINYIKEQEEIDDENISFFRKSIIEKNWYRKEHSGKWHRTFSFNIDLPIESEIVKLNGESFCL